MGRERRILEDQKMNLPGRRPSDVKVPGIFFSCLLVIGCCGVMIIPVHAFTANSLDITIDKTGDAVAVFRFTLEGLVENAIPQSIIEEELKKGLTTSSEPPELRSMDKSSAVLLMKKFADTSDGTTGTEYRTASMNFKKAEIALQSSSLSNVVSADFSPSEVTLRFPDGYVREFHDADVLPSVTHTVTDPSRSGVPTTSPNGALNITTSPADVRVSVDNEYLGDTPATFFEIPPGSHTVVFQKEGFEPVSKVVTITAGKTTMMTVFLEYATPTTPASASMLPGFEGIPACLAFAVLYLSRRWMR